MTSRSLGWPRSAHTQSPSGNPLPADNYFQSVSSRFSSAPRCTSRWARSFLSWVLPPSLENASRRCTAEGLAPRSSLAEPIYSKTPESKCTAVATRHHDISRISSAPTRVFERCDLVTQNMNGGGLPTSQKRPPMCKWVVRPGPLVAAYQRSRRVSTHRRHPTSPRPHSLDGRPASYFPAPNSTRHRRI